ncbi:hypothetical protein ACFX13_014087 [Malus domestica]
MPWLLLSLGSDDDGVVDIDPGLGAREEGSDVLEVEHLAAELVRVGVDEDEFVSDVLGEDGEDQVWNKGEDANDEEEEENEVGLEEE